MKRLIALVCLATAVSLTSVPAQADNINGNLGLTGKTGFLLPADNESDFFHNRTDAGVVGGGGLIYGIDDHLAAEFDLTRTSFGSDTGDFGITNISLGGQYRFAARQRLVPYLGAGIDILLSDYDPYDGTRRNVDTTLGAHISGGVDYFLLKHLALTGEAKMVIAPDTDITDRFGDRRGNFDPSSFSTTAGIRYFFK